VSPFKETVPVPVEKVPVEEIAKSPEVCVYPVMCSSAPALVNLDVPFVKSDPSERFKVGNVNCALLFKIVNSEVPAC